MTIPEKLREENVLRYPRLDTVLMVEEFIKNAEDEYTKTQLWKKLPKKMMYQTFCVIIDYLESHNKIHITDDGYIVWTYDPEGVKYYMSRKDLGRLPITDKNLPEKT